MNPLQSLHELGERVWLDTIRRAMLEQGTLQRYIEEFALTGLTSNPTIFEHAIVGSDDYDEAMRAHVGSETDAEALFYELAIEDLQRAADLFRPVHERSDGRDGFVSLELSPVLADDAEGSVEQALELAERVNRPNVLIKVPGTVAGARAIEELIYRGIAVNVTLLFSAAHYQRAAEAYMKGLERRLGEDRPLTVASVASLFVSRWDKASAERLPGPLRNRLGSAIARHTYARYRQVLNSERWRRLADGGARAQRLLWASTGTKDPDLPAGYYVTGLTAAETINTMPEATLLAFARDGKVGRPLPEDGGDAAQVLEAIARTGIDCEQLAEELQIQGKAAFSESYRTLLSAIQEKMATLAGAAAV